MPRASIRAAPARAMASAITTSVASGRCGPCAYFGWPADATAEEGHTTIEALGHILADAVREWLKW